MDTWAGSLPPSFRSPRDSRYCAVQYSNTSVAMPLERALTVFSGGTGVKSRPHRKFQPRFEVCQLWKSCQVLTNWQRRQMAAKGRLGQMLVVVWRRDRDSCMQWGAEAACEVH